MQSISFKPYIKNIKADGTAKIYITVTIDRKNKLFPTKINVKAQDFNNKKGELNLSAENYNETNYLINEEVAKLKEKAMLLQVKKMPVTFEKLKTNEALDDKILNFAFQVLQQKDKFYTPGTARKNAAELKKLERFNNQVTIKGFDLEFIHEFENYMSYTLKNKTNTIAKTFSFWRMVLNEAIRADKLTKTPFHTYRLKKEPTSRIFLSMEQLHKLEKLLQLNESDKYKNTISAFLFGCYTGLRYSDIKKLTPENFQEDRLLFIQDKTKEQISLPLNDRAKKLIDFQEKKLNFKLYTNEKLNVYIKEVAPLIGVSNKITFHSSRHTFATIAIELNIPIEIISKLLGHQDLKTTQIYAKITDKKKFEEMEKFNF